MFSAAQISYSQVNNFSKIIKDYLDGSDNLKEFFGEPPSLDGIQKNIYQKQQQPVNRKLLVEVLALQYKQLPHNKAVRDNINQLNSVNTFTVCTAHQPNLFTGPIYFIYKIIHTIRLSIYLNDQLPGYHFVPVYYMGSEDADFAELNHTYVEGKKIEWKKEQTGAVGRMIVDQTLLKLIDEMEGQLYKQLHGEEVIRLLRNCYTVGKNIQSATFELVNELYGSYGLVVVIPDDNKLKSLMKTVFHDDLFQHTPSAIVRKTSAKLEKHYAAQAHPRDINLFYLKDNIRERIERRNEVFTIVNTNITFTEMEMRDELELHPERFSPNVILRGIYQEMFLPNLAFVGGGGELAYWLQLKEMFHHYHVVFPVLILRNSFLIVEKKWMDLVEKTGLTITDFFSNENILIRKVIENHSAHRVSLNGSLQKLDDIFDQVTGQAKAIDLTLEQHVAAIRANALKNLEGLEKKMLRAEKRKYSDQQQQIHRIREVLFPGNGLQERVENFSSFYAKWGVKFIEELYKNSLAMEQKFTLLIDG